MKAPGIIPDHFGHNAQQSRDRAKRVQELRKSLTQGEINDILTLAKAGRGIIAIKQIRERFGVDLGTAKEAFDQIAGGSPL